LTSLVSLVAGIVIVLGAMHLASAVVSPFLLGLVLALIFWPLYVWLKGHGLGTLPALIVLLAGLVLGSGLLALLIAYSVNEMAARLSMYTNHLSAQLQGLDASAASHGLNGMSLANVLSPDRINGAFGALVGGLTDALAQAFVILLLLLFFLVEGPALVNRLRLGFDQGDPNQVRLVAFGREVAQYFALRAAVNAVTGAGVALVLWLLGVDFPLLWGVLTFFLSFIPYIGMFLASVPSVLLAWAEFGLGHAVVVAVALTVVNATAENLVQPALMHRGLHLSPTFVFVSVFFWGWLLPGGGSFLAIPISLGLLVLLSNFPDARWFTATVMTKSDTAADPLISGEPSAPPGSMA
jgi:predicted PurR-regulated permease PerM